MKKLLIVEDDQDVRETIRIFLESENFIIEEASCGHEAIKKIDSDINLIVLDVMMPDMNGYKLCQEIRKKYYIPILFLTAKSRDEDKLLAFRSGGDDFLSKPFSYFELSARISALLRRSEIYNTKLPKDETNDEWLTTESISINIKYNKVLINNLEVQLTETEYNILLLLITNPEEIFSIQDIHEHIYPEDRFVNYSNSLVVHIKNLRKKLSSVTGSHNYIITVWGKGYRFVEK